jgi:FKBP-type peptidyl-prolyl cis-trans isomerase 2
MMIEKGKTVSLEYTVCLEDGMQIDSNVGEDPLIFVVGKNQLFPTLEYAIVQLGIGEQKEIFLRAEEAYGPVMPEAFKEVELNAVPSQFRYTGAILGVQDPAGGIYPVRVHAVDDAKAVLDFNHPLAGKNLRFTVKVVEVS